MSEVAKNLNFPGGACLKPEHPGGRGGLTFESDGDARRLAKGCKFWIFGLTLGVSGKTPIFLAIEFCYLLGV